MNIEQLGVWTVKLRHKDEVVKYRFFEGPENSLVLLETPDMEVLGIPKFTYEAINGQQVGRMFNSQIT